MIPWFLVTIGGLMYIGPFDEQRCKDAAAVLQDPTVSCRQATAAMLCPVPDHPEVYKACPVFDFPKVTVKP